MTDLEYEAFERFCIMSNQSDVTEEQALKYIEKKYGTDIANNIIWRISK